MTSVQGRNWTSLTETDEGHSSHLKPKPFP